jgi:DNA-binding transcriptional MerR regulator
MEKSADAFRTISEVAEDLNLPQHVLRFWETRFNQIRPMKRGGGRRYYRPDDVDLLSGIKHLLYGEGYTIKGVQRILKEEGLRYVQAVGREGTLTPTELAADTPPVGAASTPSVHAVPERVSEPDRVPVKTVTASDGRVSQSGRLPAPPLPLFDGLGGSFSADKRDALKTALVELTECRRLLGSVDSVIDPQLET